MNESLPHAPIRVFVLLRHGLSRNAWQEKVVEGSVWEKTPYGYDSASSYFALRWSEDRRESAAMTFARRGIQRVFGADILHVVHNLRAILSADVVWTHTEREHLALLLFTRRGKSPRVIAQSVWLWDRWASFGQIRRALYSWLLRKADAEIVHSRLNLDISQREVPGRRVVLVPFGTTGAAGAENDAEHARRDFATHRPRLVSAGNDHDRDWSTLATCARELSEFDFVVFSSSASAAAQSWSRNVEVRKSAGAIEIRNEYATCDLVILPLRRNQHASGATVAGESMSAGKPLVVADAGGLEDYVGGPGAYFYESGNARSMASAIQNALKHHHNSEEIAGKRLSRGLTPEDYVRRYEWISLSLMDGSPIPQLVSEFAKVPGVPLRESIARKSA